MKVLMLGWEYPPHISGGLGTACEGLTTGLAHLGVEVIFVVPHLMGGERAAHMTIVNARGQTFTQSQKQGTAIEKPVLPKRSAPPSDALISRRPIPSFLRPYMTPEAFKAYIKSLEAPPSPAPTKGARTVLGDIPDIMPYIPESVSSPGHHTKSFQAYGGDLFGEVGRFAANVAASLAGEDFDLIHCHDWMTYPAGVALARISRKPLVVHVHSLEYDRSGVNVNPRIHRIERLGVRSATRVIAVSYYTRGIVNQQHGVPLEKICVVHNGVYECEAVNRYRALKKWPGKIVLFLGRITFQKGPEYFVEAAARVIPHVPNVLFVMAGTGDMLPQVIDRVSQLGIGKNFSFPGFLKGQEVEEMFSVADLYVMPSVSEPFGLTALEAIKFDTPVIISRQSGVSEVLTHALKFDFWDIERQADLMINALRHDELRTDMVAMAREEIKRQHWDAAALKTKQVYSSLV